MIGSLESAASPLLVVLAMIAATYVGDLIALRQGFDLRGKIWAIAATGLVAARVGYVCQYHAAYAISPWSMLDIRDGGWNAAAGFVVICLYALRTVIQHPEVKRPIRWALLAGTLLWVSGSVALTTIHYEVGSEHLPALTLATAGGAPVKLSDFRGKPVVLNLWATWCPPCNREMPMLAQAQAAHPELQFVFIDQGESASKVSSWMAQRGLAMRNVLIDSTMQTGKTLNQRAFPTTYFFDAHGSPVTMRIGELSLATLTERLERLAPSQR